jgi:hypothetical protein
MTRPRARPKPGRYYLALDGTVIAGAGYTAEQALEWVAYECTIVECVPMPRVRVVAARGTSQFHVEINGVLFTSGPMPKDAATKRARDLRRALRGK